MAVELARLRKENQSLQRKVRSLEAKQKPAARDVSHGRSLDVKLQKLSTLCRILTKGLDTAPIKTDVAPILFF